MVLRTTTPYSRATSGVRAREETTRLLRRIGCTSIGFMDDFQRHELILQFTHRDRKVMMRASGRGWAAMHCKGWPHRAHMRVSKDDYEKMALAQGQIAINSVLRDWVKGQVMAVESGIMSFETAFLPYTLLASGESVAERVAGMKLIEAAA